MNVVLWNLQEAKEAGPRSLRPCPVFNVPCYLCYYYVSMWSIPGPRVVDHVVDPRTTHHVWVVFVIINPANPVGCTSTTRVLVGYIWRECFIEGFVISLF